MSEAVGEGYWEVTGAMYVILVIPSLVVLFLIQREVAPEKLVGLRGCRMGRLAKFGEEQERLVRELRTAYLTMSEEEALPCTSSPPISPCKAHHAHRS